MTQMGRRLAAMLGLGLATIVVLSEPALAHVGAIGERSSSSIPTWLTVLTGGAVIGASFLFTSLLTDHEAIRLVNGWHLHSRVPERLATGITWIGRAAGVLVLGLIVASGFLGPKPGSAALFAPTDSFAILVVWAGWWAGFTMTVYAVGNAWPLVNPWRGMASLLPRLRGLSYPESLGAWPSVAGLLGLVLLEVMSPVGENPRLLALTILGYTVVTLAGAALLGTAPWFERVDPIARVFRAYGRMAPLQRTADGVALSLPTTALTDHRLREEPGATAFVIALLWATTYDGLVATPAWEMALEPLHAAGVPVHPVYVLAMLVGFWLFYRIYKYATRRSRDTAGSYVEPAYLARYFAPAMLPIAAGYHLAHFLGYFLGLLPSLVGILGTPLSAPANPTVLAVPDWFGVLQVTFVLLGHVLAIWVAHSRAFELFPGVFKPIKSQYPLTIVMICYTVTSLWIVVQPFGAPPFV